MTLVLEATNLEKKYKDFTALKHLNLHVKKGAIYGLIGKNGAGKTTLIRIICGLQEPTNGTYAIYGVLNHEKITEVRKRMGAIIETPSIYGEMTARDNLIDQYKLVGMPNHDGITILISSHYLDELSKIATHYGFLDKGFIVEEISHEELMKKLERKIELTVNQPTEFVKYFEKCQIPYEVIDRRTINVYGKYNLSSFITELSNHQLTVEEIHEHEESLESYYMNLIGGAIND